MDELMSWARAVLGQQIQSPPLKTTISLDARRSNLGPSYERGTVAAFEYTLDAVPEDGELLGDLRRMLELLSLLYQRADLDPLVPGTLPPEVELAVREVEEASGRRPTRATGQGFRFTKPEQRAVERRAVDVAVEHYQSLGWLVTDVGDRESYDLHCTISNSELYVESRARHRSARRSCSPAGR